MLIKSAGKAEAGANTVTNNGTRPGVTVMFGKADAGANAATVKV